MTPRDDAERIRNAILRAYNDKHYKFMKHLNHYTDDGISKALDDNGAFFAFNPDQFKKHRKPGIKYTAAGAGLICPTATVSQLLKDMDKVINDGISRDLAENGAENIIKRELINYECYYTGDIRDAVEALEPYGITADQVNQVYKKNPHH